MTGYYLYDITPIGNGQTRYTYCKKNIPPFGPGNPSFEICDKIVIVRKATNVH